MARLPRDTGGMRNYRRSAVVERCCVEENRRRAVSYVSTGLARLPRDTGGTRNYRRSAVVEIPSPHRHRRGAKRMRAGGSPLLVAGRLPTDGYDAADSTFLDKIFSVIYTTALRR